MLPAWVNEYIGKPFEDHGRGPDAFDCWGLVKHVLETHLGLFGLPDFSAQYHSTRDSAIPALFDGEQRHWPAVDEPQIGDVVVMRTSGRLWHVGVVVAPNRMLHVARGMDACLDYLDSPRWRGRIESFRRHPSL